MVLLHADVLQLDLKTYTLRARKPTLRHGRRTTTYDSLSLDLTSRTSTVGMFAKAWFYNQMGTGSENILLNQFGPLAKAVGRFAADQATSKKQNPDEFFVDGITGKDGRTWRSYLPSQIAQI